MNFSEALIAVKQGNKIQRAGWNGPDLCVIAQYPDEHSKMTLPYLYIEYPEFPEGSGGRKRCPWFPSQTDIMEDDWRIIQ
jgi:hypothetical protein